MSNPIKLDNIRIYGAQRQGSRDQQEDAWCKVDASKVAVVADGVGGLKAGNEAAKAAVERFVVVYEASLPKRGSRDALFDAAVSANEAVVQTGRNLRVPCACTLVASVVTEVGLYWVSTGDSRIYLIRDEQAITLTSDHNKKSQLADEVAAGSCSLRDLNSRVSAGGFAADMDMLMSSLGKPGDLQWDRNIRPMPLLRGDFVLLCSDGVYDSVEEVEIVRSCAHPNDPSKSLLNVVESKRSSAQDNYTAVVFAI